MFALPTLGDLMGRARNAFRANLKGSDAWVWPNNIYVSAKVLAGMTFEVFGYLSYVSRQMFAHTAPDLESLLMHGEEFGIPLRPAAPAEGAVKFTCDAAIAIDVGAVLQRTDGVQYIVTVGGALAAAGDISLKVVAALDGKAGNAIDGTPLEIVSGVTTSGVATAEADGDIIMGADVEGIEDYRARILFRKRNPPHGGAAADYVMWAMQVSGVTRVFVERLWNGGGTVRVYVLMDDAFPNGIPDAAAVARVQSYIDTVAPAGAIVTVAAPVAYPVDVGIAGLAPMTTDVQNAVNAELRDMFFRRGRVSGGDTAHGGMPFLSVPETFSRSWVWQAAANASGEDRHSVTAPAADILIPIGRIAVPGTVTVA